MSMRRALLGLGAVLSTGLLGIVIPVGNVTLVLAQTVPTPTVSVVVRPRPIRVRPTRPPRQRPVRAPRVEPTSAPTRTPTPTPHEDPVTDCEHACHYTISQMRLLWYGGVNFSAVIRRGGCEALTPDPGDTGTVQMTNFVTAQREDTGHELIASFVLGNNGVGVTSLNGTVQFSPGVDSHTFSYSAPVPSFANIRDGQDFPVAFTMCVTLGHQAIKMHLVCQGKNQGMLCHEG